MPTTMQDRERGFEAKFAHDEEMRFMVQARRDKLFARWAAAELGLSLDQTEALVRSIIHIPDGPGHDKAVLDAIAERLTGHATRLTLTQTLNRCMAQAHAALDVSPQGLEERLG